MSETTKPYNEIDDYIAAFSDEEHQDYVAAETALDLASMLYQIRQEQGLTQQKYDQSKSILLISFWACTSNKHFLTSASPC